VCSSDLICFTYCLHLPGKDTMFRRADAPAQLRPIVSACSSRSSPC
jgi:hypothetical protein